MATEKVRIEYDVNKDELSAANKELEKLNKNNKAAQKEVDEVNDKFKDQDKELNSLNGTIKKVGLTFAAVFAADNLIDFAKGVVEVTGEFQKMEAVLRNTLGSSSRAQKALREIQEFAATTPFAVSGLTNAFIKLANQGFVPTINEMRKLGDIAASTGKDFDQLAEAIIDAQVGEFERLKEFGIRSQKEGDKVRFTFKGVQEQVDFTSEAIQNYILSLGDIEGVAGSTGAISDTVAGKISNLGDNFESLQKTLGDNSSGLISGLLDFSNSLLGVSTQLADKGISQFIRDIFDEDEINAATEAVDKYIESISSEEPSKQLELFRQEQQRLNDLYDDQSRRFEEGEISRLQAAENRKNIDIERRVLQEEELGILASIDAAEQEAIKTANKKAAEAAKRAEEARQRAAEDRAERGVIEAEELAKEEEKNDFFAEAEEARFEESLIRLEEQLLQEQELKAQAEIEESNRRELQAQSEIELDNAVARNKEAAIKAVFNLATQVASRGSNLAKGVALAQIAFDTAKAIASLTAASEANPANSFTFGGAGIAQFIAGIARITANVAQAKSVLSAAPRFEEGGRIGGNRHSQGGTLIEAELGEHVINRKATSKYGHALFDSINNLELDPSIISGHSGGSSRTIVDTRPIADQLKKMPQNNITVDEDGFRAYHKKGHDIISKKIRRYSI